MDKYVVIGYSGHSYVVLDAAQKLGMKVIGYTEKGKSEKNPYQLNYLGFEQDDKFSAWDKEYEFLLGIGDNRIREKVSELVLNKKEHLKTIIHPSSSIATNVYLGDGAFIASGTNINACSEIGRSVIVNTGSIIEHECKIDQSAHIAPGAVLAGNVTVGERSFIGANSVIKEGVNIGTDVVIGAGAVVLKDVANGHKVVGNPGKII